MAEERKVFIPLENNPEVMTSFAHALGLPGSFTFHDIYSLDPTLLSAPTSVSGIPRPIHALIFIFPITPHEQTFFLAENGSFPPTPTTPDPDGPVVWFPQTIKHACGLIALLHTLLNNPKITLQIPVGTPLHDLGPAARATPLSQRGTLLSSSTIIETLHAEHGRRGDTAPPPDPATWADNQGFVAFVRGNDGHVWELEGRRRGPVDRGLISAEAGADMLSDEVLERTVGPYIKRERDVGSDIRFSLVGLAGGSLDEA